ncbi:fluoride efflux transporter CrcB [Marinilongibacter aquaticus]|uniref:fluoride efflux transporter CrcB n=1 Tax=Marinilongibacter aquaticus TaxID=2975157 RepID=UPI0021BDA60C|nr:fluoride efflux transporter CrcB [Marinilongibacter aquaticus]UBM57451.1 fluoride efflux transporter CrcB [Marinilongibacter aquaticus]
MKTLLYIFIGGGAGSILRYLVAKFSLQYLHENLPFGTIIANVLASLVLGFITVKTMHSPQVWKPMIAVGFCGGFSTYSTFSNETFALLQSGQYGVAGMNALLNLVFCLAAIGLGMFLGR